MKIEIVLSENDIACLEHDLLDIEKWVRDAVAGKINACKKRMINQHTPKLIADADVQNIAGNEADLIAQIRGHKDYKNRKQLEALNAQERG